MTDADWMRRALALAERAQAQDEAPVGALVVDAGECIGEGWNQPISSGDPTAHAEILALRAAARAMGNYRLPGVTLYATLEPCAMCAGAIVLARVKRLVFAAADPRAGAVGSVFNVLQCDHLNHRVDVTAGVLANEAADLLRRFFRARRGAAS